MEKKWFIGIDISKKTLDVAIYDLLKKKVDKCNYKQVTNQEDGYLEVYEWCKEKGMNTKEIVVCMENTGVYGLGLCLFFENKKIDYSAINPLHLKRSMGFVKGKNDRVDAQRIAQYCYLHRELITYTKLKGSTIVKLNELDGERKIYVKQAAAHKGYVTDRDEIAPDSGRSARSKETIKYLENRIAEIEKEMIWTINNDKELLLTYKLLLSINGIGHVNATHTLIHTDNFRAFENARQYASYLGIAPFENSSGSSIRGKTRVYKTGTKTLKADLSQAAKSAVTHDPEIREYYKRKMAEGKAYGTVLNAVKFKLVERMFAVVNRGTPFVDVMKYKKAC